MRNRKPLTDEELNEIKRIQETKESTKDSILFGADLISPKEAKKKRDKQKESEVHQLIGGGHFTIASVKELNKMLLKQAGAYMGPLFIPSFYDVLRKLTGFKKSKKHPNYNPSIFAVYTLRYVYRRFKIKNLISELQSRNPFLTGQSIRANKHFQYLKREEDIVKLVGFIKDVVEVGNECNDMTEFDEVYCRRFGLPTDGVMF
ncbi:MAG: hypothetical protein JNK14_14045 [Chitinophagaceae bacterium]|nr:hypothetical protein [Chitinophagaceae bacterium]